jgi:DNA-binding LacI/PurR family transcriptional regulator
MVTIADVARVAGVAPSTVSYVLTGKRSISPETQQRVQAAIDRLGFMPHAGARALRASRTNVLALSEPALTGPKYRVDLGQFVHDLSRAAREHGYDLLLLGRDEGTDGIRRLAGSRIADGAILMGVLTDEPRVAVLRELGFPAALIGHTKDPRGLPWCDFDFEEAAALAVQQLTRLGHRSAIHIADIEDEFRKDLNYPPRLVAGARAEARRVGMRLTVMHRPVSDATLLRRLRRALDTDPAPTAIITSGEVPALPALLRETGRNVPRDISIIAVGSTSNLSDPPQTRLPVPITEMSELAVALVVGTINGDEQPPPSLVPPRLIQGRSTAPVPER